MAYFAPASPFYPTFPYVCYEKLGHMLKPLVLKFRHDRAHFKDIAEKQVPAKLKPYSSYTEPGTARQEAEMGKVTK